MEPQAKQITLHSFFLILWRQKYAMIGIVILSVVLGYVAFKRAKPVWESSSEILVLAGSGPNSAQDSQNPMNQAQLPGLNVDVTTQIEVLQSSEIMGKIYSKLGIPMPDYMTVEQQESLPQIRVEQINQTNALRITVDSSDYDLDGWVSTELPTIYEAYLIGNQRQAVDNALAFLKSRKVTDQQALDKAQKAVDDFRMRRQLPSLVGEAGVRSAKVESTQQELFTAETQVAAADERLQDLVRERAKLPKTLETDSTITNNAEIDAVNARIADLKKQRDALLVTKQPDHVEVRVINAQIQAEQAYLRTLPKIKKTNSTTNYPQIIEYDAKIIEARVSLRAAQVEEQHFQEAAAQAQQDFDTYNKMAPAEDQLTADLSDKKAALLSTNKSIDYLTVRENSNPTPIATLMKPSAPSKVKPKGVQYLALAFFMGIFLAVGFALTKDGLEDKLSSAEEVYALTGLPSLGEIPALPSRLPVLAESTMNDALLESYRVLRFNIKFSTLDSPVKSIVVTSSGPGEGKTELACNLAIAASGEGRRVILVDANLRNPMIHKKMNVAGKPGLTDVVAGEADLNESMHWTSIPGLRVLTCGSLIATPAELLASPQMRDVYDRLVADSDLVIFDAPSSMGFADTQILSNVAQSVVYVARSGKTKRLAVKKGIDTLRQANARILGVATSGVGVKTVKS